MFIHQEKEFGVRLLDRTKSPLALTAAGKVYANYLEDSSQLYEQLLQDFTRLNASRRQTLRVAMSNWRASTLLPSILPAFSQEHPEAHLELLERPTSEMCSTGGGQHGGLRHHEHQSQYARLPDH